MEVNVKSLGMMAAAIVVFAGFGMAGCKSQPGSLAESMPAQQSKPFAESGRSERREGGNRQGRGGRAEADAAPGAFDFYLLTLSWSPEFCVTHPDKSECAAYPGFVLHGLWPQNNDGTYPENCSNAPGPANPGQYSDIYPDAGLLQHEWKTHGTCSGLAADAYFQLERRAVHSVVVPKQLAGLQSQIQLTPTQIVTEFTQANPATSSDEYAVSCGNNRLTAVELCLNKNLQALSCSSVKTCRANVVKVTPPGATTD
jgi:ribonuclease T2